MYSEADMEYFDLSREVSPCHKFLSSRLEVQLAEIHVAALAWLHLGYFELP